MALLISSSVNRPLYILFVREQPTLNLEDFTRAWTDDHQARVIFKYAKEKAGDHPILPCYAVSDSVATTIVEIATTAGASHLILGAPRRNTLVNFIRGNLLRRVSSALPKTIHFVVYNRQGQ
jgi:nucleotide-binding universal stress UspA family protein